MQIETYRARQSGSAATANWTNPNFRARLFQLKQCLFVYLYFSNDYAIFSIEREDKCVIKDIDILFFLCKQILK